MFKEFHRHHNWFRLWAVIVGLEQAGIDTTKLNIVDPRASKADLRAKMGARPGLPLPHAYTCYNSDFFMALSIPSVLTALKASPTGINQLVVDGVASTASDILAQGVTLRRIETVDSKDTRGGELCSSFTQVSM